MASATATAWLMLIQALAGAVARQLCESLPFVLTKTFTGWALALWAATTKNTPTSAQAATPRRTDRTMTSVIVTPRPPLHPAGLAGPVSEPGHYGPWGESLRWRPECD